MEPRKRRKGPVILIMLLCIMASLGAGVVIGRSGNSSVEAIKNFMPQTATQEPKGEAPVVELQPLPEYTDGGYDTTEIFEKVNPSVVSINVYAGTSVSPIGSGTGIIMTEDGYIITNAHVVDGGTSVNIVFNDETQIRGTIIGADADTDIAVIKVDKKGLTAAEFGDSKGLKIGERVVAIGN
ncbi:MAG: trypsin-like peptidase domain-containing protein, partial [Oscillospiraceae bacterium]|nr:trypsin-like peptidase domain-containing protein [Oscillospiraceae bacterium]